VTIITSELARGSDAFVAIRPSATLTGARQQFESLIEQATQALRSLGLQANHIVRGWVRFAEVPDFSWQDILTSAFNTANRLPITGLVQPPADTSLKCILELHLDTNQGEEVTVPRKIPGSSCFDFDGVRHVQLMSIAPQVAPGNGTSFEALTYDMFEQANHALGEYGLSFSDVARTWVHVSDIDNNYAAMNRARNRFFRERGLKWSPASTCVQAVPVGVASPVALDVYALAASGGTPFTLDVLHSSAMGEASSYGVAFSRAIRIRQRDVERLFVSGTASIDARGHVVSVGDVRGQLDRMFRNLTSLLGKANFDCSNIRSATTYLKHADYLADYVRAASTHGLAPTIPCGIVVANICRPEWLCEVEVFASRFR
jgi:enamine deaminase RidA (YjgF/YER057c/UK114 family)